MTAIDHTGVALDLIAPIDPYVLTEEQRIELAKVHTSAAAANQLWMSNLINTLDLTFPDELEGKTTSNNYTGIDLPKRQERIDRTLNVIRAGLGI